MPRSAQVRARDLQQIITLIGECQDLGDDPVIWSTHFTRRLAGLVGAAFGQKADVVDDTADALKTPPMHIHWGLENGFNARIWTEIEETLRRDPYSNPVAKIYCENLTANDGKCFSRTDLVSDRDWYRSGFYQNLVANFGGDAMLMCFRSVRFRSSGFNAVILARSAGEPDFSIRAKAVVEEAQCRVCPLIGRSLAGFTDPIPSALPSRVRLVLQACLEGESDKQIAARLGISRYTVNDYTKTIYRYFGVRSRPELQALWIRRRWNGQLGPEAAVLLPRARQVLHYCLEGDSNKEIATRLGIPVNAVKEYMKLIYGHFGVRSRAELLARWVHEDWGSRFAWR